MRKCANCGSELGDTNFCTKCGAKVPKDDYIVSVAEKRFCTNCGAELGNEPFCTACGAKVEEQPQHIKQDAPTSHKTYVRIKPLPVVAACAIICVCAVGAFAFGSHIKAGSSLLGQWELVNDVSSPFDELELFSDSTYASDDSNYNGDYSIDGDRIKFEGVLVSPIDCTYEVGKDTLTIICEEDGDTWEFRRVSGTEAPSGKNSKASKKLQGQWEITSDVSNPFDKLEFFSDGTYSSDDSNYNGRYSVDGDRIKFEGLAVSPVVCSFELNGDVLTLTHDDNEVWEFEKLK